MIRKLMAAFVALLALASVASACDYGVSRLRVLRVERDYCDAALEVYSAPLRIIREVSAYPTYGFSARFVDVRRERVVVERRRVVEVREVRRVRHH